jgi:diguanylate cyclase (GGDEF)-like protein
LPGEEAVVERVTAFARSAHVSEQLERELARARRTFRPCALLMTGVDRFEEFVATVGAATWEQIAQALMITLRDICRDGDMVGRQGTDRHLVFLPDADGAGAALAARRYLSQLYRRPIIVPEHEPFYLDASIGIALFPVDGSTASELLASASTALALAQQLGGRRAVAA